MEGDAKWWDDPEMLAVSADVCSKGGNNQAHWRQRSSTTHCCQQTYKHSGTPFPVMGYVKAARFPPGAPP